MPALELLQDAEKMPIQRAEFRREIAAMEAERRSLALAAQAGQPEAKERRAALKIEIAAHLDAIELSEESEIALRQIIANDSAKERQQQQKHLKRKMLKGVGKQVAVAKDLDRGIEIVASNFAVLLENADTLRSCWPDTWPTKGGALLYSEKVNAYVGHAIAEALKRHGVKKLPEINRNQVRDYPGSLLTVFQDAANYTKKALIDGEVDASADDVELFDPAPVPPAPVNVPEALSGREFNLAVDNAEKLKPRQPRDINPFDGSEI